MKKKVTFKCTPEFLRDVLGLTGFEFLPEISVDPQTHMFQFTLATDVNLDCEAIKLQYEGPFWRDRPLPKVIPIK